MDGKSLFFGLGVCFLAGIIGTFLATKLKKQKFPIASYLGFLVASSFFGYLVTLIVHILLPHSLLVEAAICGLVYHSYLLITGHDLEYSVRAIPRMYNTVVLRRTYLAIFGVAGFACFCDWVLFRDYMSGHLGGDLVEQALVPLAVVISVLAIVIVLRDLYLRIVIRSRVEIDSRGVVDNASKARVGFIPWGDIENIDIFRGPLAAMITVRYKLGQNKTPLVIDTLKISEEAERTIKYLHLEANSRHSQ